MSDLLRGRAATRVFACFAAGYFLSYALRSINAVIAPELVADFSLSAADLGSLTSAYLFAFAAMQLPLGWALDRFGPRRVEAALLLVAAAGCAVYGSASGVAGLWVGRAMIGMGVSACLMAAFKGFRYWFPPERQGQLAAWMLVVGTSGVLLTTVPVQWLLPLTGWRGLFAGLAGALALASVALFVGLPARDRDTARPASAPPRTDVVDPARDGGPPPGATAPRAGYAALFRDAFFWRMSLIGVFHQGGFIALQTLWAGPWFTGVMGADKQQASQWLFAFNVALLLAYIGLGWAAPRLAKRGIGAPLASTVSNGAGLAVFAAIVLAGAQGQWWWWLGVAACTTVNMLLQAHVNMSYPARIAGRASTAFNFMIFIGAFGIQWGLGLVIDAFRAGGDAPADAFRHAFWLLWALQAASLAGFAAWRVRAPAAALRPGPQPA